MNFTLLDWLVLAAYLVVTVTLGLWARRYVENLSGYIVAGRRIGVALGVATFSATELGTVTFVYFGELGYVTGFSCFIIGLLAMAAYMAVGKTGFIIARLRAYGMMTIPEFYELRYSRRVRLLGGIILFLGGVLNMGVFLKFDGIFLSEVMGFGPDALAFIMTLMLVIVMAYTILGGMFSVVITDFMQYVVLSFSMLVVTAAVLLEVDLTRIGAAVTGQLGAGGYNPVVNPRFGWTFIVWILVSNVAAAALWQPGTSKALASKSPRVAKKVFWITGLTFAGRAMIPMFWGIAALAFLGPGVPTAAAMPKLLGEIIPGGLLGLLVAGLLAASMSTYSSYLLAWSSVATLDVVSVLRPGGFSERTTIRITRLCAGVIGVFLLVFGLWYEIPETAFQYLFITGAMYTAGALGCVTAGLYWPRANTVGAYAALLLGALAPAGFLVLERVRDVLPAWLAFAADVNVSGVLSFALAALGMVAGSLLTQRSHPSRPLAVEVAYDA
jgi:SSS family solute:Na+ symporter